MAFLKIHTPHASRGEPHDYSVPLSEALHRHLHKHTRTPFYIGKLSGQEFVLILTRFSAERLNRWLLHFLNHLQKEVFTHFNYGQPSTRCHAGVVELGTALNYQDSLAVARSACDCAINQNEHAILYRQNTRSEEHTSELQSRGHLVCRLLLEKNNSAVTAHRHSWGTHR